MNEPQIGPWQASIGGHVSRGTYWVVGRRNSRALGYTEYVLTKTKDRHRWYSKEKAEKIAAALNKPATPR